MPASLENSAVAKGLEKPVFITVPKAMPKNVQTTTQLHSSHTTKLMLKILQARLNSMWTSRCSSQRSNCQHLLDHWKSKRIPEKYLLLLYLLCQCLWLCGSQQTGKFFKRWEYQTTWPDSWEICMQVRKQQLELNLEQQTGSILGKEYVKVVYCHPAYLTSMQSTSCKIWVGWSTSWNQDCWEKYQ